MLTEGQFLTPRYRIDRQLKKGGMGVIYEAYDKLLDAPVAIKENRLEDAAMGVAFEREAKLLANLRHPSLPRCSDLLSLNGGQFLVMEFIEGDDLAALMTKRRTWLTNEMALDVAWQVLDALEYIHGESVLHRDIKPSNIKLRGERVYLLDFGLAYGQAGEMETVSSREFKWECHSKGYSPPEQLKCQRTCPASDLYSLAATLYFLLTNIQPPDAEERFESVSRDGKDPLEDVRMYNPAADELLCRAVMRALSLAHEQRPQSAREMRDMIFPTVEAAPSKTRKFVTARLASEVLVLGALVCLLFVWRPWKDEPSPKPPAPPTPKPVAQVIKLPPAEEAARLAGEAERLWQRGEIKEAWSKLKQAVAIDKNNPYVHFLVGNIRWEDIADTVQSKELMPEVRERAEVILHLVQSPRSGREYVARAWANFVMASLDPAGSDQARLDLAIADANEALAKYDQNSVASIMLRASATYMRPRAAADAQTVGKVLADYARITQLAPEYAQARANLASIHLDLGRRGVTPAEKEHLILARDGFERALGLSPRAGFYHKLGLAHFRLGDLDRAIDSFHKATLEDLAYHHAYVGLADVYFKTGRWKKAEMNYLEANNYNKDSRDSRAYVFKMLCATYNRLNDFDAAERNCRLALERNKNDQMAQKELTRAIDAQNARVNEAAHSTPSKHVQINAPPTEQ